MKRGAVHGSNILLFTVVAVSPRFVREALKFHRFTAVLFIPRAVLGLFSVGIAPASPSRKTLQFTAHPPVIANQSQLGTADDHPSGPSHPVLSPPSESNLTGDVRCRYSPNLCGRRSPQDSSKSANNPEAFPSWLRYRRTEAFPARCQGKTGETAETKSE